MEQLISSYPGVRTVVATKVCGFLFLYFNFRSTLNSFKANMTNSDTIRVIMYSKISICTCGNFALIFDIK